MRTLTAIIRVKSGDEEGMRDALLAVAAHVRANEPDTVDFFISQDREDKRRFTTYERFLDQAAMDRHNNSEVVARFFAVAEPMLDGPVTIVTTDEIFAKE